MRFYKRTGIIAITLILMVACSQSKWSEAEQEKWLETCRKTFVDKTTDKEEKARLEDLCDCMLMVTSRKYTVEEAQTLTENQMRQLFNDCNYSY